MVKSEVYEEGDLLEGVQKYEARIYEAVEERSFSEGRKEVKKEPAKFNISPAGLFLKL